MAPQPPRVGDGAESAGPSEEQPPFTWLNTEQATRVLGVNLRTLYRFIDEGQLVAYKMGRVIRIKSTDVDAFIEGCRIEPGTVQAAHGTRARTGEDRRR